MNHEKQNDKSKSKVEYSYNKNNINKPEAISKQLKHRKRYMTAG